MSMPIICRECKIVEMHDTETHTIYGWVYFGRGTTVYAEVEKIFDDGYQDEKLARPKEEFPAAELWHEL